MRAEYERPAFHGLPPTTMVEIDSGVFVNKEIAKQLRLIRDTTNSGERR